MFSLILHGRKSVELQKWRNFMVSVSPFQNAFAFSSASAAAANVSPRKGNNFTVSYLVESLGLTIKLAESISRRVDKSNRYCHSSSPVTMSVVEKTSLKNPSRRSLRWVSIPPPQSLSEPSA